MAAQMYVNTALRILLAAYVSQVLTIATAENATSSPKATNPTPSPEQLFVDATIRLITAGDNNIRLDASLKDVILLVGKTGSGKTTMTKFIAEPEKLESYHNGDRYLIRDVDDEISKGSDNVISKTIFPNLIIDNSTGNAFYDMPGFKDTRNASIEIANAWFMKTVAEHAQRVKVIFVVTHSSLLHGGNRKDVVTLLKMATDFIKSPSKFKDSISLIATKVDHDAELEDIIQDIGEFLQGVKNDLDKVIDEPIKRETAKDLLDAFLVKYPNGTYSRISFFWQPQNKGPLTAQDDVMELRHYMRRNLDINTEFVATSPNDFGISLSHDAILSVAKIAQVMNQMIADAVTSIGNKISKHFEGRKALNSVGSFLQDLKHLEAFLSSFSPTISRQEFIQRLQVLVDRLNIPGLQDELTSIGNRDKNLQFFEQVSQKGAFHPNIREWFSPLAIAVQASRSSFSQMVGALNSQMTAAINKLNSGFQHKIRRDISTIEDPEVLKERLGNFSQTLQQFLSDIPNLGKSYNQFAAQVRSFLIYQGELSQASEVHNLKDDIPVQGIGCQIQSQLKISKWLPAFENLLEFVEEEEIKLKTIKLDEEKLEIMAELDALKGRIQSNMSALITRSQHEVSLLNLQRNQSEDQSKALLASLVLNCNSSRKDLLMLQAQELMNLRTTNQAEMNSLNGTLERERNKTVAEEALCTQMEGELREDLNSKINNNKDILKYETARRANSTSTLKERYGTQVKAYQERCALLQANGTEACKQLMSENQKGPEEHNAYLNATISRMKNECYVRIQNQKDICSKTLITSRKAGEDHKILMNERFSQQKTLCQQQQKSVESECVRKLEMAGIEAASKKSSANMQIRLLKADCEDQILKLRQGNKERIQHLDSTLKKTEDQCDVQKDGAFSEAASQFARQKKGFIEMWESKGKCCTSNANSECLDGSAGTPCCGATGSCNGNCCNCPSECHLP